MKDLKPFNKEPECPKCLGIWMVMKHFSGDDAQCDYINVVCKGCGYSWNMEVANPGKKQVIMEELVKPNPEAKSALEELGIINTKDKVPVDEKSALTLLKENDEVLKDGMGKVEDEDTKLAPVEKDEVLEVEDK